MKKTKLGPGLVPPQVGERQLRHVFDGFGMVGAVHFNGGPGRGLFRPDSASHGIEPSIPSTCTPGMIDPDGSETTADRCEPPFAHQCFLDSDAYRAARRGKLTNNRFLSRLRFEVHGCFLQF